MFNLLSIILIRSSWDADYRSCVLHKAAVANKMKCYMQKQGVQLKIRLQLHCQQFIQFYFSDKIQINLK